MRDKYSEKGKLVVQLMRGQCLIDYPSHVAVQWAPAARTGMERLVDIPSNKRA